MGNYDGNRISTIDTKFDRYVHIMQHKSQSQYYIQTSISLIKTQHNTYIKRTKLIKASNFSIMNSNIFYTLKALILNIVVLGYTNKVLLNANIDFYLKLPMYCIQVYRPIDFCDLCVITVVGDKSHSCRSPARCSA